MLFFPDYVNVDCPSNRFPRHRIVFSCPECCLLPWVRAEKCAGSGALDGVLVPREVVSLPALPKGDNESVM